MKFTVRNLSTYIVVLLLFATFIARATYSSVTLVDFVFFISLITLLLSSICYASPIKKSLQYVLFILFLFDFAYSVTEKQAISNTTIFLILQTNLQESIDYFVNHSGFMIFVLANVLFLIILNFNNTKNK